MDSNHVNHRAILIRDGNDEGPLFLIHDGLGSLAYASILAPHLSSEITICGLAADPSAHGKRMTLEGIASQLATVIREVNRKGPYRLVGYSFGAILAYEIAVQLVGNDQLVDFLGIIDCDYNSYPRWPSAEMPERIMDRLPFCRREAFSPSKSMLEAQQEIALELSQELADMVNRYYPQPLRVPVYIFHSSPVNLSPDVRCGWQSLVSAEWLRALAIPGSYRSMMQAPNVPLLGTTMSSAIVEAGIANRRDLKVPYNPLVTLQNGKAWAPRLFCVPGAGATVVSFANLLCHLERNRQVYGLQPRGMDGHEIPHLSLDVAASCYANAIKGLCVDGPIHLLGHSFGGWIAFEMAYILCSVGCAVASLTIVDSMVPYSDSLCFRHCTHSEVLRQWLEGFEMLVGEPLGICVDDIDRLPLDEQLARIHQRLLRCGHMPTKSTPAALRGPLFTFAAALRSRFLPKYTLHGNVHLVIVDNGRTESKSHTKADDTVIEGWRHFAPDLDCYIAPGNHMTVLKEPQVKLLGEWLEGRLRVQCSVSARARV